jgi:ABC-type multidrug transport system permease subunit
VLKRLRATPMRRRDLFAGQALARLAFIVFEAAPLLLFGHFVFATAVRGSLALLALVTVAGAACFTGLALLLTARVRSVESVAGVLNLALLPMVIGSGIFFSTANFPAALQPVLRALPATALLDALRAVAVDGASLAGVAAPLAVLGAWGAATAIAGALLFRWE